VIPEIFGPLVSAIISSTFLVVGVALIISASMRSRKVSGRSVMASLSVFILIGALVGGVSGGIAWAVVRNNSKKANTEIEKIEQQPAPIEQKSSGSNSPNIVGNGNTVIIHPEAPKRELKPKSASILAPSESLHVGATPGSGEYIQKFGGIEWKPEYSELQIAFSNPTLRDFVNLDFTILPDIMIAGTGEVTNFHVDFVESSSKVPLPPDVNEQTEERRKKGQGYKVILPATLTNATRFRCAALPRHSVLIIVLALVNQNASQTGTQITFTVKPYPPKALPKHLAIEGSYQDREQPYELSKEFKF
jgi:hypothetical protein